MEENTKISPVVEENTKNAAAQELEDASKLEKARIFLKAMIADGKLPAMRALTRSERRALSKEGLCLHQFGEKDEKNFAAFYERMQDWILDNAFKDFDFEDLPNNICAAFAICVYKLTYEDDFAIKN